MRDRDQRLRGFEEAHERIPSSVADAESAYNRLLRDDAKKHQSPGVGYLEHGSNGGLSDFTYQHVYGPTMEMLKTHLGHHYKADKTKAF